jgi:hypothetical protein
MRYARPTSGTRAMCDGWLMLWMPLSQFIQPLLPLVRSVGNELSLVSPISARACLPIGGIKRVCFPAHPAAAQIEWVCDAFEYFGCTGRVVPYLLYPSPWDPVARAMSSSRPRFLRHVFRGINARTLRRCCVLSWDWMLRGWSAFTLLTLRECSMIRVLQLN